MYGWNVDDYDDDDAIANVVRGLLFGAIVIFTNFKGNEIIYSHIILNVYNINNAADV